MTARAIQYAKAKGLKVLGIDGGEDKGALCTKLGADAFVDFTKTKALGNKPPSLPFILLTQSRTSPPTSFKPPKAAPTGSW